MPTSLTVEKSAFHVPKRRVRVRIELLNGSVLTGSFYADQHDRSGGPGRVSDRLNNESEPFIPLAVELRLRVKLTNGSTANGKVVAVLPQDLSRALDFLNCHDAEFFAMISGEQRITLVNLRHIESVTEFVEPAI